MAPAANYLRLVGFRGAARVDEFIANSENVRRRIWKTYRRESLIVRPPVDVEHFHWKPSDGLFPDCFRTGACISGSMPQCGCSTKMAAGCAIVGDGPEYKALRRAARREYRILRTCR